MELTPESASPPAPRPHPGSLSEFEWSFREELFSAMQRWYWIVLFCLAGSLIAWLLTLAQPSPHRVSKELFVGLNVYQSGDDRAAVQHSGLPFVNANDYKNWQMSSLNTIIYMDPVLDETLTRLRAMDPYWEAVSRDQLAGMLHAYWRNAGKWRLVAEHNIPMYATQAVILWQDVVVEQVHLAVAEAQNALSYDEQLQAAAQAKSDAVDRAVEITRIRDALAVQLEMLEARPDDEKLSEAERMQIWQSLASTGEPDIWDLAGGELPFPGSTVSDYRRWIAAVQPEIAAGLADAHLQYETHAAEYIHLTEAYSRSAQASMGLSAELLVQKISDRRLEETEVRPTGQAILIGAGLGFLLWAFIWLIRPALRSAG